MVGGRLSIAVGSVHLVGKGNGVGCLRIVVIDNVFNAGMERSWYSGIAGTSVRAGRLWPQGDFFAVDSPDLFDDSLRVAANTADALGPCNIASCLRQKQQSSSLSERAFLPRHATPHGSAGEIGRCTVRAATPAASQLNPCSASHASCRHRAGLLSPHLHHVRLACPGRWRQERRSHHMPVAWHAFLSSESQ